MEPPETNPTDDYPMYLTVAQVQELTQLGRGLIYRLIEQYRATDGLEGIPAVRFGRSLRVPREQLREIADQSALERNR